MVVVTANCATSDHRPTLGGRCAIECIDGADYGFFVMAEITSFPAGMCRARCTVTWRRTGWHRMGWQLLSFSSASLTLE